MKIDIQPLKDEIAKAELLAIRANARLDAAKTEYESAYNEQENSECRVRNLKRLLGEYESICAADQS